MHAVVAQEFHITNLRQPFVIVDHDCVSRAVAKCQERFEGLLDTCNVCGNLLVRQERAGLVLVGRIADLGRAPAHQDDGLATGALEMAQHHDLQQRTNV